MMPPVPTMNAIGRKGRSDADGIDIHIEVGAALVRGTFRENAFHKHFACQIVVPDNGEAVVEVGSKVFRGQIVLVEPEVPHRVQGPASLLLLEPDTLPGAKIVKSASSEASPFWLSDLARPLALALRREDIARACVDALELLDDGLPQTQEMDPRIALALKRLDLLIGKGRWPASVGQLADETGLSTSRFRHLFAQEMRIAWSRYLLWRKLEAAVRLAKCGQSLTACAYEAGFADAAHLSRAFRTTFGFTPSGALGSNPPKAGRSAHLSR